MTPERFATITGQYSRLRLAVVGDFCLDRYLEIDPTHGETSIETGLPVHNVTRVRSQPGGAGTIVNNLAALGVGRIYPVGFSGEDGEGYELRRALSLLPAVRLDHFIQTSNRHTFTYCKPLIMEKGKSPRELSRLDKKNWTSTPAVLSDDLSKELSTVAAKADAFILLSQVDLSETGVLTRSVLETVRQLVELKLQQVFLADSRLGLRGFPPTIFKMNAGELGGLTGMSVGSGISEIMDAAKRLAMRNRRAVFVTLAERGIIGAMPDGQCEHVLTHPVRGEIDIVGAGDSVTANLTAALAAGANLTEALEFANAAASIVIHQLGTTGNATVTQLREVICPSPHVENPSESHVEQH